MLAEVMAFGRAPTLGGRVALRLPGHDDLLSVLPCDRKTLQLAAALSRCKHYALQARFTAALAAIAPQSRN
jgi:hypothetical protein